MVQVKVQVQAQAKPEPWVQFRSKPCLEGSRTGLWPV